MSIKEKMIARIKEISGNENADLWTLRFNEKDALIGTDGIKYLGVTGNVNMAAGNLRTEADLHKESKAVRRFFKRLK